MLPRTRALFAHHVKKRVDATPLHAFNRVAAERAGLQGINLPWIDEENATENLEKWPLKELVALPRKHDRNKPRSTGDPVIVVLYQNQKILVDGTTRINRWGIDGNGPHDVLVVTVDDPAN